jgi:hypothetical protein
MSRFTVSQAYQPTPDEISRWAREAEYFAYQEPNRNAPSNSVAAKGWGVPKEYKPPVDAVEFVTAMFKRDVAGVGVDATLRPEFRWSIFSVCMAHFLWLRTEAGANWALRFYGVEEVPPFKEAYAYFYLNKDVKVGTEPARVPLDESSGVQLRIFRSCERELDPPIVSQHDQTVTTMQELLRRARDPNSNELIAEATPDMYFWVSEQLRDWFLEPKVDTRWPSHKSNRISGPQWIRELERRPGVKFFEALSQVEANKGRAYRLKDKQGSVLWCGGSDIRFMLRVDHARSHEQLSEHHIEGLFRCSSCAKIRTCTPATKHQKMCCHCYGSIVEKDTRPTLDWCTMRECKHCPDHLENKADLVNLKNRLNREAQFPVRR